MVCRFKTWGMFIFFSYGATPFLLQALQFPTMVINKQTIISIKIMSTPISWINYYMPNDVNIRFGSKNFDGTTKIQY